MADFAGNRLPLPPDFSGDPNFLRGAVFFPEAIAPPDPPDPPPVAPTIGGIAPLPPEVLPTTPVRFVVTGATLKTIVWVYFARLRIAEVVWDGERFMPAYIAQSSRLVVGGEERYVVLREPQWPGSPEFFVFAAAGGVEAVPAPPVNLMLPTIAGSDVEGSTLTVTDHGTWENSPFGFMYQWLANDVPIVGATSINYTTTGANVGDVIDCDVYAINAAGVSAPARSNAIGPIVSAAVAPTNDIPPALGGAVSIGASPTVTPGVWSGTEPITYLYTLRRDGTPISGLVDVSEATIEAYEYVAADTAADAIDLVEQAANSAGSDTAISNAVAFVPANLAAYFADYDADLGVEVTTGNPASDTDTVQRWLDQATGARHLTQATAGLRPTYRVGDGPNGHNRVFFTASLITRMEATMSLAQPHTIFLIGRSPFSATNVFFYDGSSTRSALVKLSANFQLFSTAAACTQAVPAANTWFVDEAEFNGASSLHRVDAATPATGNPGAATLSNLRVGAGNFVSTASSLDGDISRLIIFNAILSAADKTAVRNYLAREYGVTV